MNENTAPEITTADYDDDQIIGEEVPCLVCGDYYTTTEDSGPLCPDCVIATRP